MTANCAKLVEIEQRRPLEDSLDIIHGDLNRAFIHEVQEYRERAPLDAVKFDNVFLGLEHAVSEHRAQVRTTSRQHHLVGVEFLLLHTQHDITEFVALAKLVHHVEGILHMAEDGESPGVYHGGGAP